MNNKKVYRLEIRLDYLCNKKIKTICKKTKLTKSEILRKLIMNEPIKEKPDSKFYDVINELINMSNNLKVISEKAEYLNEVDKEKYDKDLKNLNEFITLLRLTYL